MVREHLYVKIPNPHHGDEIGTSLLAEILRKAKIGRDEWFSAKWIGGPCKQGYLSGSSWSLVQTRKSTSHEMPSLVVYSIAVTSPITPAEPLLPLPDIPRGSLVDRAWVPSGTSDARLSYISCHPNRYIIPQRRLWYITFEGRAERQSALQFNWARLENISLIIIQNHRRLAPIVSKPPLHWGGAGRQRAQHPWASRALKSSSCGWIGLPLNQAWSNAPAIMRSDFCSSSLQIPLNPVQPISYLLQGVGIRKPQVSFSIGPKVNTWSDSHMGFFQNIEGQSIRISR